MHEKRTFVPKENAKRFYVTPGPVKKSFYNVPKNIMGLFRFVIWTAVIKCE